jgi:hypothetical protein
MVRGQLKATNVLRQSIRVIASTHEAFNPLPTFPVECIAYTDTTEWWFPCGLSHYQRTRLRRLFKGGKVVEYRKPNGFLMGYRAGRNQPDKTFLLRLAPLVQECGAVLCRLDIALDCDAVPMLGNTILQQAVLNWRRQGPMQNFENGNVNWVWYAESGRRPNRNLSLYTDRPNRFTGELDCVHLELRFLRADIIRKQDIHSIHDLLALNPKDLFDKHLRWSADGQEFEVRAMKQAVLEDRAYYRGKETGPFIDQYRASIPRRVRSAMHRVGSDRSQVFKDAHPRYRLNTVTAPLHIPTTLTWG